MEKAMKTWLIVAAVLALVGAVIFVGALAAVDFDFSKLSARKLATNTYELHEDFENIFVNVETAAVTFVPSEDGVCRVVCVEEENLRHSVKIQDGTLTVSAVDTRNWYDYICISFRLPTVTVYLPKEAYTALSVTTATGDITIPDSFGFETVAITGATSHISCSAQVLSSIELSTTTGAVALGSAQAETVKLSAATGNITVKDTSCNQLTAKSSTGQIKLNHVIAQESINAESTTGGVQLVYCDANQITVKTSTGNVKGTLLSEKIFITDTSTGSVSVPKTTSGGRCEITTNTGDIEIKIA